MDRDPPSRFAASCIACVWLGKAACCSTGRVRFGNQSVSLSSRSDVHASCPTVPPFSLFAALVPLLFFRALALSAGLIPQLVEEKLKTDPPYAPLR